MYVSYQAPCNSTVYKFYTVYQAPNVHLQYYEQYYLEVLM